MAAPQVSGAALLIRQYFQEGFYTAGSKDSAAGHNPSAALVKAMILHSGQRLAFPKRKVRDMGVFPDFEQGHGSMLLSSVLWFGEQDSDFDLAVFDRELMSEGEHKGVCISNVDASQPLKVTLQWTDPPASQSAAYQL
eukprot:3301375-Rhodomonas_salina.1